MEKLELENHFNESHQPQYNEMTFADSHATFRMLTNAHNLNAVTVTLALLPLNQDPGRPGAGLGPCLLVADFILEGSHYAV